MPAVVRSLLADAGATGSILGSGKIPHAVEHPSLSSTATEPVRPIDCASQQETSPHKKSTDTASRQQPPLTATREACVQQQRASIINQKILKGKVRWVDKEGVVRIQNGILLRQRKNEAVPFTTTRDAPGDDRMK